MNACEQLRLGESRASCVRSFPTVLYVVQAGSWGRAPSANGTLPSLVISWITENVTYDVVSGHTISTGTLSSL